MRSPVESVFRRALAICVAPAAVSAALAVASIALGAASVALAAAPDSTGPAKPESKPVVISGHGWPASMTPATPRPVLPEGLTWVTTPEIEGLRMSWIVGGEKASGAYLVRVRLADGARIPPHTHPDHRVTTVLSGTAYVGFGARFDEKALVKIPAGGVYEVPAGVPHYAWAKDGDVEYQESGVGPTGTTVTKP